jgi:hypothetical protein
MATVCGADCLGILDMQAGETGAYQNSLLWICKCNPGLERVFHQALGHRRAAGGQQSRRRVLRRDLLPERGSFSVSMPSLPTPSGRGAAAAIGLRFAIDQGAVGNEIAGEEAVVGGKKCEDQ